MIIISTHAVFLNGKDIYGPPHAVSQYLNLKRKEHIFIKHRLFGDGFSRVEYYEKGKMKMVIERGFPKRLPFLFQYILEIALTVKIAFQTKGINELYIGVDPLNAFAGNILKLTGRARKSIFFCADFALKRFPNPVLNSIYLRLDDLAMKTSDATWSVSTRIVEYRRKHKLPKTKNLLMPNAPFYNMVERLPYTKMRKHDAVLVSALSKGIAFDVLLEAFARVREKIKDARLILIGDGPEKRYIKEMVNKFKLKNSVIFKGAMSHEEMFRVLVRSGVGIALYSNAEPWHFRYFSDPMKVRDYWASGLPVIISGNSAINAEMTAKNAGFVVDIKEEDVYEKLYKIMKTKTLHEKMYINALKIAEKYDTYTLIERYLSKMIT